MAEGPLAGLPAPSFSRRDALLSPSMTESSPRLPLTGSVADAPSVPAVPAKARPAPIIGCGESAATLEASRTGNTLVGSVVPGGGVVTGLKTAVAPIAVGTSKEGASLPCTCCRTSAPNSPGTAGALPPALTPLFPTSAGTSSAAPSFNVESLSPKETATAAPRVIPQSETRLIFAFSRVRNGSETNHRCDFDPGVAGAFLLSAPLPPAGSPPGADPGAVPPVRPAPDPRLASRPLPAPRGAPPGSPSIRHL